MLLEIISGQPNADIEDAFANIVKSYEEKGYNISCKSLILYPEIKYRHSKTLYNAIRKRVRESIKNNEHLFIVTYSDHAFNALRVEIKLHNFEGALCHQIRNDGKDTCSNIWRNGSIECWEEDVFDTWENALFELT